MYIYVHIPSLKLTCFLKNRCLEDEIIPFGAFRFGLFSGAFRSGELQGGYIDPL